MKRFAAIYRSLLVAAILILVALIGLGQIGLNAPREAFSLEQPLFSFSVPALEPLRFSAGGKLHTLAWAVLALWAVGCFWDKETRPFRSPLALAILVFLLVCALAWFFSSWRDQGWKEGLREILADGALALTALFVLRRPQLQKIAVLVLIAAVLVSTLGGLYLYRRGVYFPDTAHRIWLAFLHPNAGGSALLLLLPLVLSFLIFPSPPGMKAAAGAVSLALAAAMLLTFSRTAWISLLFGLFVLSCRWRGRWHLWSAVALAVFLIVVGASAGPRSYFRERVRSVFDISRDVNLHKRLIYWQGTARLIARRPLLGYGTGYQTFMAVWEEQAEPLLREQTGEKPIHPHSLYLSLAFSVGLAGLAAFVAILWRLSLILGRRELWSTDWFFNALGPGLLAGFAGFLFGGLIDQPLFTVRLAYLFWFLVGLTGAREGPRKSFARPR
jgi:O-antigen ligase